MSAGLTLRIPEPPNPIKCPPKSTLQTSHGEKKCIANGVKYPTLITELCGSGYTKDGYDWCVPEKTTGGRRTRHKKRKVRKGKSRKYRR